MINTTQNERVSPRRRWVLPVVSGVVGLSVLVVAGWWLLGGANVFHPRTVSDLLASTPSIHPEDNTAQLCSDRDCIEGWQTDVGTYLRFPSTGQAEYQEIILGDQSRRSGSIVLDMSGVTLSADEKRQAIDVLFADRDWY